MKFLVSDVERGNPYELQNDGGEFLTAVIGNGRVRYQVNTNMLWAGFGPFPASPLLQAMHAAFANHLPFRMEPAYLWTTIIQEVAMMVGLNPEKYATVFNGDPNKKKLVKVRCDELLISDEFWPIAIAMFEAALAKETGEELVNGFQPGFSTDDETRKLVYLISLMKAGSPYFDYKVESMCGIPEIHLEGTIDDWRSLYMHVVWLEETFGESDYFTRVKSLIDQIGHQVYTGKPDVEFWKSMYKFNSSSFGEFVSGWIADFYLHLNTKRGPVAKTEWSGDEMFGGFGLAAFPTGVVAVPFIWETPYGTYPMRFCSGFTGMEVDAEGAVGPLLGYVVVEGEG